MQPHPLFQHPELSNMRILLNENLALKRSRGQAGFTGVYPHAAIFIGNRPSGRNEACFSAPSHISQKDHAPLTERNARHTHATARSAYLDCAKIRRESCGTLRRAASHKNQSITL